MTTYVALETIAAGAIVTNQPTAGRIVAESEDYAAILSICLHHRLTTYRHTQTGEVRQVSEKQITACPWDDQALYQWLHHVEVVSIDSYAIPLPQRDLMFYEPDPTPAPARKDSP